MDAKESGCVELRLDATDGRSQGMGAAINMRVDAIASSLNPLDAVGSYQELPADLAHQEAFGLLCRPGIVLGSAQHAGLALQAPHQQAAAEDQQHHAAECAQILRVLVKQFRSQLPKSWYALAESFPAFLLGCAIADRQALWARLASPRKPMTLLAVLALTVELALKAASQFVPAADVRPQTTQLGTIDCFMAASLTTESVSLQMCSVGERSQVALASEPFGQLAAGCAIHSKLANERKYRWPVAWQFVPMPGLMSVMLFAQSELARI